MIPRIKLADDTPVQGDSWDHDYIVEVEDPTGMVWLIKIPTPESRVRTHLMGDQREFGLNFITDGHYA